MTNCKTELDTITTGKLHHISTNMGTHLLYLVLRSVTSRAPLLIEYAPDLTRSVSISQGASPSVNHGATGNCPSSNPSKYNDPAGPSPPPPPATVGTEDPVSFKEMVGTRDVVALPIVGTIDVVPLLIVGTIDAVSFDEMVGTRDAVAFPIVGTIEDVTLPTVGTMEEVSLPTVGTIEDVTLLIVGTSDAVSFEEMVGSIDEDTLAIVGTIEDVMLLIVGTIDEDTFVKVGELVVTLDDIDGINDCVTFITDGAGVGTIEDVPFSAAEGEPVTLTLATVGTEDVATGAKLVMTGGVEVPACHKT